MKKLIRLSFAFDVSTSTALPAILYLKIKNTAQENKNIGYYSNVKSGVGIKKRDEEKSKKKKNSISLQEWIIQNNCKSNLILSQQSVNCTW